MAPTLIENETIVLAAMAHDLPQQTFRDYTFRNCTIEGPTVVIMVGPVFRGKCQFDFWETVESIIWQFPDVSRKIVGAVPMINCVFDTCHFMGIGFAFNNAAEASRFRANIPPPTN